MNEVNTFDEMTAEQQEDFSRRFAVAVARQLGYEVSEGETA